MAEHRVLAFYLPQFHPIQENDMWYGPGFTEWRTAVMAHSLFDGHIQPRMPADLGFYDLRTPETRLAQAEMAAAHGIDGFVYYHYWFQGRQVMERPMSDRITVDSHDFPFAVCWANLPWKRTWSSFSGTQGEMLIPQQYDESDDARHLINLLPALTHENYVRVKGRPLFLIFSPTEFEDITARVESLQRAAERILGDRLYIGLVRSDPRVQPTLGVDAIIDFQPSRAETYEEHHVECLDGKSTVRVVGYDQVIQSAQKAFEESKFTYPCVTPGWDSTPRKSYRGLVIHGATPDKYSKWLEQTLLTFRPESDTENLVFVNAWNEWGESCYLEPDMHWGDAYLRGTARARQSAASVARGR
ncbi:glycoside hydrolase family 99-like domain-containing protein [Streptomyces hygroscopicus]|uniref:glycoside hydrolase family 99-like domain-containing protein n=1 Tax=Streptomyces hygroscopicus TaxID=1912 RepID=UPI0037B2568D